MLIDVQNLCALLLQQARQLAKERPKRASNEQKAAATPRQLLRLLIRVGSFSQQMSPHGYCSCRSSQHHLFIPRRLVCDKPSCQATDQN